MDVNRLSLHNVYPSHRDARNLQRCQNEFYYGVRVGEV
jgi:hypothetical protein